MNHTQLERERQLIKLKPKNFANFKKLLVAHASMLEVYEYVEAWEEELQQLKHENEKNIRAYSAPCNYPERRNFLGKIQMIDEVLGATQ